VIVLGIDTATAATAVALRCRDGVVLEARDDPAAGEHPGHATRLLGMAGELLEQASLRWSELDRIAVGAGPGTFTGLRVGVASARGLAQSLGVELVAVSSLHALASPALGEEQLVLAAIDARRGEVFAALFAQPGQRQLGEALALAPKDAAELLADGAERAQALAVGDGALRYRAELQAQGLRVAAEDSPLHLLRAAWICELALAAPAQQTLEAVLPDYRRRPDAELALGGGRARETARA
jgi:tRNA threonylcarbamoyladenosine biosynthesis protein TsaB